MGTLQNGQFLKGDAQSPQQPKWPHGIKITDGGFSKQMAHTDFSVGAEEEEEEEEEEGIEEEEESEGEGIGEGCGDCIVVA